MKFRSLFASILIFFSGLSSASTVPIAHPQTYNLAPSSLFHDASGSHILSGSFSMQFPFGLPPIGNLSYLINDMDFSTDSQHLSFTGYNIDLFPLVLSWPDNLELGSDLSIELMRRLYLNVSQTGTGGTYYEYMEEYLEPVFVTDETYNRLTFTNPGDLLPNTMLLTYELHLVSSRATQMTYPPGVTGPLWSYTVLSDTNLGILSINAVTAPVPEPNSAWLMGFGLSALAGLALWRRATWLVAMGHSQKGL